MATLHDVQSHMVDCIRQRIELTPVTLKYPFPERPARMLGLVRLDGEVYGSDHFLRIVCLRISLPFSIRVYSTFIRPRIEYDLPVFSCEVICMGGRRIFVLDIHDTGENPQTEPLLLERLLKVRSGYPDLLAFQQAPGGRIQTVHSQAACRLKIGTGLDERALALFHEYLEAYIDLAVSEKPLDGAALDKARADFKTYLKTVIDHDPGVKGNMLFFGRKGGTERALDIFYGV